MEKALWVFVWAIGEYFYRAEWRWRAGVLAGFILSCPRQVRAAPARHVQKTQPGKNWMSGLVLSWMQSKSSLPASHLLPGQTDSSSSSCLFDPDFSFSSVDISCFVLSFFVMLRCSEGFGAVLCWRLFFFFSSSSSFCNFFHLYFLRF